MTKLENTMAILLTTLAIAAITVVLTGIFSSFMVLGGNFKSYRETYAALETGNFTKNTLGDHTYFKIPGFTRDVIRFSNGSIKLLNNDYLHANSFVTWMSPYSLYYKYKFNKLFKNMETQEDYSRLEERVRVAYEQFRGLRDRDMREDAERGFQWHTTRVVVNNKPKEFKFLTKNQ